MKLSTEALPGGTQPLGGRHMFAAYIAAHLSPQGTGQQVGTDSCMVWAPSGVGTLHWTQDKLCYRNTTCLLHFLLEQNTLRSPDQSAQHGSGRRIKAPSRPTQDGPPQAGASATLLVPGPCFLLLSIGVTSACSQRCSEVLIRTQVTVLTQRWPSPGCTGENFPQERGTGSGIPVKTGIRRAMFLGAGVSLHLPVACTYMIYMQKTEKGARWTRKCSGIALGPFTLDITAICSRWRGFVFVSSWGSGRCTYCHVWGDWTQNSVRRVMSVGLGRGHVCIQEALNLEPLYLRLSPRVRVPVTHSSSSSFSLNY